MPPAAWCGPLLEVTHAQLRGWLATQPVTFVEDPSNAQLHLDRNYLRAQVLPLIRARWPPASATVARSARHAAQAQRLLDALAAADLAKAVVGEALSARVLRTLTPGPAGERAALLDQRRPDSSRPRRGAWSRSPVRCWMRARTRARR